MSGVAEWFLPETAIFINWQKGLGLPKPSFYDLDITLARMFFRAITEFNAARAESGQAPPQA